MIDVASRDVIYILVATFGGAVVGLEREWSGHASGPNARFAGVRTFTLIGGLSGIAGWLCASASEISRELRTSPSDRVRKIPLPSTARSTTPCGKR